MDYPITHQPLSWSYTSVPGTVTNKAAPPRTGHHIKADCRHHGGGLHRTRITRACECGYEKTDASDLGYLEPFLRALQAALLTTN